VIKIGEMENWDDLKEIKESLKRIEEYFTSWKTTTSGRPSVISLPVLTGDAKELAERLITAIEQLADIVKILRSIEQKIGKAIK